MVGFIWSNFVSYFCKKYPEYKIYNLDKLIYSSNLDNSKDQYIQDRKYALEQCNLIDLIYHIGIVDDSYNFGGCKERNKITIVKVIRAILDFKFHCINGKKMKN